MDMDTGGLNWFLIDVVAVGILLVALIWVVMRTRSKGKETSSPRTDAATRERYEAEDKAPNDKELCASPSRQSWSNGSRAAAGGRGGTSWKCWMRRRTGRMPCWSPPLARERRWPVSFRPSSI